MILGEIVHETELLDAERPKPRRDIPAVFRARVDDALDTGTHDRSVSHCFTDERRARAIRLGRVRARRVARAIDQAAPGFA